MKIQRSSNNGETWLDTSEDWLERTVSFHYDNMVQQVKDIKVINANADAHNKKKKNKDRQQTLVDVPDSPETFKELMASMKKKKNTPFTPLGPNSISVRIVEEVKKKPDKKIDK